jgi:hypothetical protein
MHEERIGVVSCVSQLSLGSLRAYLARESFQTFDVIGQNMYDKRSLIAEIERSVLGPEAQQGNNNWDAFADNLWWAVTGLDQASVAILWLDVQLMLDGLLPLLLPAVSCIEQVAQSVVDTTTGSRVRLRST